MGRVTSAAQALLALLSLGVAGYALVAYTAFPLGATVHPEMRAGFEAHRTGIAVHVYGAAIALLLGPLQFSRRLRAGRPALHRLCGRLYLTLGVGVGGVAGLYLACFAYGGLVSSLGFASLATAWLYTGARAYAAIRARRVQEHRAWMVCNFALAFAAVTLRIELGVAVAAGVSFEAAYPVIAWLSWIPNLLLARWLLRKTA